MKNIIFLFLSFVLANSTAFSQFQVEITDVDNMVINEISICHREDFILLGNALNIPVNTYVNFKWIKQSTSQIVGTSEAYTVIGHFLVSSDVFELVAEAYDFDTDALIETTSAYVTVNKNNTPPNLVDLFFCDTGNLTVADLNTTVDIIWYSSSSIYGTPIDPSTVLTTQNFYGSQIVDGCESTTTQIFVEVISVSAPVLSNLTQGFCDTGNPTIADLVPNWVNWYDAETNGTLLTQDVLLTNTIYYASNVDPSFGCESEERTAVSVVFNDASFAYSQTEYCNYYTNPRANNIIVYGGVFTINNGGEINPTNGEINLATSYPGTDNTGDFIVNYTLPCGTSTSFSITILGEANFTYATTYSITGENPIPLTIYPTNGIFTIDNGGTINATTGEIDIFTLIMNTEYSITYTSLDQCNTAATFTINIVEFPVVFPNSTVTITDSNPIPTILIQGGLFTINNSATIDENTGEVDLGTTTINTTYTITYTYDNNRSTPYAFELTVVQALSLEEDNLLSDINIYPNPSTNFINLKGSSQLEIVKIEFFDVLGKNVKVLEKENIEETIDVSKLDSGLYYLKISSINSSIIKELIIQ